MKYKVRFIKVHLFERKALEAYFQMMAEKGWKIRKISNLFMLFERIEPTSLYFHIGINPKYSNFVSKIENDEKSEYRKYVEKFHYQFLCAYHQMQIFVSESLNPSFEEPQLPPKIFNKMIRKREMSDSVLQIVVVGIMILLYTLLITPYNLASNGFIVLFGILILIFLYRIFDLIPYLRYLILRKESTDLSIVLHRLDPTIPLTIILLVSLVLPHSNLSYVFVFLLVISFFCAKFLYDILLFFSLTTLKLARIFSLLFGCLLLVISSFFIIPNIKDTNTKQNNAYFLNEITSQMKERDFHSFEDSILMSIETVYIDTFAYDYYSIKPTIMKDFCMDTTLQSIARWRADFNLESRDGYEFFRQEGEYLDTIIISNNKILVINQSLSDDEIHAYVQRLMK